MSVPETAPSNTPGWREWFTLADAAVNALRSNGTTAQRPTKGLWIGRPYFDTTLTQPIWYDGTGWVDATGGTV